MHLIFDFDGTLVDSFNCAIDVFNTLADEFKFRKVLSHEVYELKNLSSRQLMKHLKISMYKIPAVLYKAKHCMHSEMHKLKPFPGISQVVKELSEAGLSLGIVTSNSEQNVVSWLERHEILGYFDFIISAPSYFGKGKTLKKILKANKLDQKKVFYIGDETRDIDAAKQCGISAVAVTWGFNSEAVIAQHEPHYLVRTPADILTIFQSGGFN